MPPHGWFYGKTSGSTRRRLKTPSLAGLPESRHQPHTLLPEKCLLFLSPEMGGAIGDFRNAAETCCWWKGMEDIARSPGRPGGSMSAGARTSGQGQEAGICPTERTPSPCALDIRIPCGRYSRPVAKVLQRGAGYAAPTALWLSAPRLVRRFLRPHRAARRRAGLQ